MQWGLAMELNSGFRALDTLGRYNAINRMTRIRDILAHAHQIMVDLGASRTSFHFTPPFASQKGRDVYVGAANYPASWMALYNDPEFRRHDPVSDYVMQKGQIMIFEDVIAQQRLTAGQQDFVDRLRAAKLNHGFGLPLYGPNGRSAYVTVGFDRPLHAEIDHQLSVMVLALAILAYGRIMQIILERARSAVSLSRREQAVLNAMCAGLSNRQISDVLGISPATVDTYVRRVFAKLDVNDRTYAILKALTLGLTTLDDVR